MDAELLCFCLGGLELRFRLPVDRPGLTFFTSWWWRLRQEEDICINRLNWNTTPIAGLKSDRGTAHDGQFKMVHNPNVDNRGNHLENQVSHDEGQFKMVHNPNVDNRRLDGNHLDNQVIHDDGHFKIAHNPTFDNPRLDGNHLDNDLVDGFNFIHNHNFDHRFNRNDFDNDLFDDLFDLFVDDGFKIHNPNFDNRRFNNFFGDGFFGGSPWWWGNEGNTCWVWWPDDGWVWQCS